MRQAGASSVRVVPQGADGLLVAAGLVPRRGEVRLCAAAWQVIAQRSRQGLHLMAHDGRQGWQFDMEDEGADALQLRVAAPRHRQRVRLGEGVRLAPGTRRRGGLHVPVEVRVVGCGATSQRILIELPASGARTAWLGREVGYVQTCPAHLTLEPRPRAREAALLVPLVLRNVTARTVVVDELPLDLAGEPLRRGRGGLVAPARRLVTDADGRWREQIRSSDRFRDPHGWKGTR